jgi:hypothetical protein
VLLGSVFLGIAVESLVVTPVDTPLILLLGFGGLGMGVAFSSLIGHLTAAVERDLAADLSGVLSTNSEIAAALGVATFGTLYLALADAGTASIAADALTWVAAALALSALLAAAAAYRATA